MTSYLFMKNDVVPINVLLNTFSIPYIYECTFYTTIKFKNWDLLNGMRIEKETFPTVNNNLYMVGV